MSATKKDLQHFEEDTLALERALYEAQVAMAQLSDFCWSTETRVVTVDAEPYHAPDQLWISYTATQLSELRTCLEEIQAARDAMSVNN